jgi:ribosomal protein L11 methyltransferase
MPDDAAEPGSRLPVALEVPMHEVELMADRLFTAGASAVAEHVRGDGLVTLVADLDVAQIDQLAVRTDALDAGMTGLRILEPDSAWNHGWRAHARAWRCGDRLVLRPAWVEIDVEREPELLRAVDGRPPVQVVIEPGDAFGSGSHVTTRLCVEEVGRLVRGGDRVLDVGCGTGVLGVAAARLGAASVRAIDLDPEAVRVTGLVADLNGVADVLVVDGAALAQVDGVFDVVLANLLIPIIEDLAGDLAARVAPGGHLVVSGLLEDQRDRAELALAGMQLERATATDGWMSLVFTAPALC